MGRHLFAACAALVLVGACTQYVRPLVCNVATKTCPQVFCRFSVESTQGVDCSTLHVEPHAVVCGAEIDSCRRPPEIVLQSVDCRVTVAADVGLGACPAGAARFESIQPPLLGTTEPARVSSYGPR